MSYPQKYNWNTHPQLREAIRCIVKGYSFHKAYRKTGVSPNTIKKFYLRYIGKPQDHEEINDVDSAEKNDTEVTVFTPEQERALIECFKQFEHLFYGLSEKECRMLAYQMVIREDIKIPVGWKHGMASIAWLIPFQSRHSSFMQNLEKPARICSRYKYKYSRTPSSRNVLWEKKTVSTFYEDLESIFQNKPELKNGMRIYSLDEAYTSINPEYKIVDRQSKVDLLTTCCFICADGASLPPVIITPNFSLDICLDIPSGATALTGSRGRLTPDLFLEVMQHFVKLSHSSLSNPSILIINTYMCHLSYAALTLAKESGVSVLTLNLHVSNLLQPLDGEILESFHKFYYDAMDAWRTVPEVPYDIGKFVTEAYSKAMTSENIENAFKKCGINPFDRDLFTDADYLSCLGQVDQTCIECRLRDDRGKKPDSGKSADKDDEVKPEPSGETPMEEPEKPGGEREVEDQSERVDRISSLEFEVLRRRKKGRTATSSMEQQKGRPNVFTLEQELEIADQAEYLINTNGYIAIQIQKLAFEYAEKHNVHHYFNKNKKCAGKGWLKAFMLRHDLSFGLATNSTAVFSANQEEELAEWSIFLAKSPIGCSSLRLRESAYKFAVKNNIKHNFSGKRAGRHWLLGFVKRNNLNLVLSDDGAIMVVPAAQKKNDANTTATQAFEKDSDTENETADEQEQKEEFSAKMSPQPQGAQELDKLKRRLIRSVARLIKDKKSEEEVWEELKKECGKNCKTLWLRMRSLTLKKLKRLLDAHDRNDHVPAVARMTLTDWLLYDLVLVHDKIDVIDRTNASDNKVLNNLFSLVQRFQIEGRSGDDLAEAWTAATVSYNSKGHQCSPMLMQRRWYQLQEVTREKLYRFWFNYRGNERLLVAAKQDPPTPLQRAIALRFPGLITQEFSTWEEKIEQKMVIMPEEFEVKMRKKDFMKPINEAVPDVVIVEQKIDTITVDSDSEFENDEKGVESALLETDTTENEDASQEPMIVQVKTEPEDPSDNIDIVEHSVYPKKPKDRFQDAIERLEIEEDRIAMSQFTAEETTQDDCIMPLITSVTGAVDENITIQNIPTSHIEMEENSENSTEIANITQTYVEEINKELESVINTFDDISQESIVIDDDDDLKRTEDIQYKSDAQGANQIESDVIDITSPKAKWSREDVNGMESTSQNAYTIPVAGTGASNNYEIGPIITAIASGSPVRTKMELIPGVQNKENVDERMSDDLQDSDDLMEDIIRMVPEKESNEDLDGDTIIETNLADDGFEFADDGIEYHEEHNNLSELNETPQTMDNTDYADAPKFDLKLLMHPVVYTTKIDKMNVFKSRSFFNTINEKELVDRIILESKPVNTKFINIEQITSENNNTEEAKDNVQVKVENSDEYDDDDLFLNELSKESDSENSRMSSCDDINRVKLSSLLLQKPRSRSYNPIQLCKNPDFNTRLKRLPLGFFSYNRNRVFLKACKPMTIDLSKAFESKLINGTMYLKPSDSIVNKEFEDVSESAASITPSAVPAQSLMNTADVDKILEEELRKRMLERNKSINLPNISVVRQINQNLLMAEVAPIITQVEKSTRDVINVLNNTQTLKNEDIVETRVKESVNVGSTNSVKQTAPVTNNAKPIKETVTDITNPRLPMMNNDKSKDKTTEKQKKKFVRSNVPLWITKYSSYNGNPYAESLLTIDTLYKVLNALDPSTVDYRPNKTHHKINYPKPGRPVGSQAKTLSNNIATDSNNQKEEPPTNPSTTILSTINPAASPSTDNPTIVNPSTRYSPTIPPTNKKAKGKASGLPKKQRNCCWARTKINMLNGINIVRRTKHKCPAANCRCCCREILRQTEINNEIRLLEQMQKPDTFDETIEEVVQQSRESANVVIPSAIQLTKQDNRSQTTVEPSDIAVSSPTSPLRQLHRYQFKSYSKSQSKSKSIRSKVGMQIDAVNDKDIVVINDTEDIGPQIRIEIVCSVPEAETETTIELDDEDENVSASEIQTPKPKIRVHAANVNRITQPKMLTSPIMQPVTPPPTSVAPIKLPPRITKVRLKAVGSTKAPAIESNVQTKVSDDVLALPCTCRPNVGIDKQSAMLVVDGSNECPRHTKTRVSKETRIYLNRRHMSTAARPFYVGKNKILLTNISPRKARPVPPPPQPPAPPEPLVPAELPAGVQVVLLPDGTISYVVDPNIELTSEQINSIPQILATIKQQIKASGVTLPVNDLSSPGNMNNISILHDTSETNDSTTDDKINKNSESHDKKSENNNADEERPSRTPDSTLPHKDSNSNHAHIQIEKEANQESPLKADTMPENQTGAWLTCQESLVDKNDVNVVKNTADGDERTVSNAASIDKEHMAMDVAEPESSVSLIPGPNLDNPDAGSGHKTTESTEEKDPVQESESENTNNTACTSRNLLSDLMEMSGILEEDVTPVQQQPVTNNVSESTQPLIIDISQDSSIDAGSGTVPPLSPTDQKHSIAAQINEKMYNLNPITSFAELKYACDNNGLFFKLDLNNGLIVPINVCIQKTPEAPSVKKTMPAEVIDLTDEHCFTIDDSATNANTETNPSSQRRPPFKVYTRPTRNETLKIKHLSTLQTPRPRGRPRKRDNNIVIENHFEIDAEEPNLLPQAPHTLPDEMEKNKFELRKRLSNNLKPLKIHYDKRCSINILRKNSVLNKITPIQSRLSNLNRVDASITELVLDNSSDDSDDEPLAKKAKKMRPNETEETTNVDESQRESEGIATDDENVDFEDAIDAISSVEPPVFSPLVLTDNPVPTQLVLSGPAVQQPLPTMMDADPSFASNESDEDSEGDCILGV